MLLSHDDVGSGPALVFIHAGVADRRMWAAQVEALAPTHRVIAPDLRGYGDSALLNEDYSNGDDIVALLDHLGIDRATLIGASYGGRVALEAATVHPDSVERLVLLAAAFRGVASTPAADAVDEEEERLIESGDVDGAVELAVTTWLGPDASAEARDLIRVMQRRAYDLYDEALANGPEPSLERIEVDPAGITVPALVVSGAHDIDVFPIIARHLGATIPNNALVELSWAGHLPSLERPDEINALITAFLR